MLPIIIVFVFVRIAYASRASGAISPSGMVWPSIAPLPGIWLLCNALAVALVAGATVHRYGWEWSLVLYPARSSYKAPGRSHVFAARESGASTALRPSQKHDGYQSAVGALPWALTVYSFSVLTEPFTRREPIDYQRPG